MSTELIAALQDEAPALLFSDLDPVAGCVFCGKPRPLELCATWMCHRCKRMTLFSLLQSFWKRRREEAAA
jgi:hypothetical protein